MIDISIFDKYHHGIIYGKIRICVPLQPIHIHVENIKKTMSNFNWDKVFENVTLDEKVALLNQTLLNSFWDYIPHKNCDYWQPPRMTNKIKNILKERSKCTKYFYRNGQRENNRDKDL